MINFAGEKYENISKHISLFTAILITSNEVYILEVEAEDRRVLFFFLQLEIFQVMIVIFWIW